MYSLWEKAPWTSYFRSPRFFLERVWWKKWLTKKKCLLNYSNILFGYLWGNFCVLPLVTYFVWYCYFCYQVKFVPFLIPAYLWHKSLTHRHYGNETSILFIVRYFIPIKYRYIYDGANREMSGYFEDCYSNALAFYFYFS